MFLPLTAGAGSFCPSCSRRGDTAATGLSHHLNQFIMHLKPDQQESGLLVIYNKSKHKPAVGANKQFFACRQLISPTFIYLLKK